LPAAVRRPRIADAAHRRWLLAGAGVPESAWGADAARGLVGSVLACCGVEPRSPIDQASTASSSKHVRDVVAQLSEAIQGGELRFGDRLPAERTLAAELDVSRTTLRKAIRQLAEAGVLQIRSGAGRRSGTIVRSELVPTELLRSTSSLPLGEISGVLQARRLLEPRVAQLAGFAATADDLAELEQVIELQRGAIEDIDQVRRLDPSFHLAIARATHNETVVMLMQALLQRLDLTRAVAVEEDEAERTIEIHERTLAAIAGRDPYRIEVTMDEHLRILERTWQLESGHTLPRQVPDFLQPSDEDAVDETSAP
jgi:GntR family transcriptional repressor for pyruvate dehydrogenase complex